MRGRILKKLFVSLWALSAAAAPVNAAEVAHVQIPDSLETGQMKLILNGAGVRSRFFVKAYVGGLYLEKQSSDAPAIIRANKPMAIKLHILSSLISGKMMEESTREGFRRSTGGNLAPIQTQMEEFISVFRGEVKENDVYDLIYVPGKGIEAYRNGRLKSVSEGHAFKQALFGIWLGENPVQESLKQRMLGR